MRSRLGPPGISTVTAISLADATKNDAITIAGDADGNVYGVGATLGDLDGANAGSLDAFVRALAP